MQTKYFELIAIRCSECLKIPYYITQQGVITMYTLGN